MKGAIKIGRRVLKIRRNKQREGKENNKASISARVISGCTHKFARAKRRQQLEIYTVAGASRARERGDAWLKSWLLPSDARERAAEGFPPFPSTN